GLLRYSNTVDLFHIFGATLSFSFLFLAFYFGIGDRWVGLEPKFLLLVLLINFFIASTLLIAFRLLAKSTYLILSRRMSHKTIHRVLIFGSDQNAVLVKQALNNDPEINYVVEGFVTTDRSMLHSYLEQKKVYHIKDLPKLKKEKHIQEMLITN